MLTLIRFALASLLASLLTVSPVRPIWANTNFDAILQPQSITAKALAHYQALDLDALFKAIAQDVHYEPYVGVLRGAGGTALSRAGNDADQTLLLATVLRTQGYKVRFVSGEMTDANISTLIMGMYPPEIPVFNWSAEAQPYAPTLDKNLRSFASQHIWLELDQGDDSWLPLDPSFPRAVMGETYAQAKQRFTDLPDTLYHRISIRHVEQLASGQQRELGRFERKVADLGMQAVSLSIIGVPQVKSQPKEPPAGNTAGIFGGSLAGANSTPDAEQPATEIPQPIGTYYRRKMRIGDENIKWTNTLVLNADGGSQIKHEWLELLTTSPDGSTDSIARDLFVADAPGVTNATPPAYRRYQLGILSGTLVLEDVREYLDQVQQQLDLTSLKTQFSNLNKADATAASQLTTLEESLGTLNGNLAVMAYAAEADNLGIDLAYNNGVTVAYSHPRIIIMALEGQDGDPMQFSSSLDLRMDKVDARPYPGQASRAAFIYQQARGLLSSKIEGQFIERILGRKQSANTMNLMSGVAGGTSGLLMLDEDDSQQLVKLKELSDYAKRQLTTSLASGHKVVIPAEPVQLAGRSRYGWWEIEPASGRMIGVMDDGLHQSMSNYALTSKEVSLNDQTAKSLGLIVGASSTQILLAGGILKYGAVTEELIKEIEATIKTLKCFSCPEREAKVATKIQLGDSCFAVSATHFGDGTPIVDNGFCAKYTDGFGCAASMIVYALKDNLKIAQKPPITAETKLSLKAICEIEPKIEPK
jgi:large repetitive protein